MNWEMTNSRMFLEVFGGRPRGQGLHFPGLDSRGAPGPSPGRTADGALGTHGDIEGSRWRALQVGLWRGLGGSEEESGSFPT